MTKVTYYALSSGYFLMRPDRRVFLDLSANEIEMRDFCKTCGRFRTVLTDTSKVRILKGEREIGPMEIVRSEQVFGGNDFWSFVMIVGDELAARLRACKMNGFYFLKVTQ